MIPTLIVFLYLGVVLYIGIFAFRSAQGGKEEFFVANRSLGTFVFLMTLFGSNMTAFAILGSSGLSFRVGIGVYGLMASISGIVIPLSLFFIGTRLWAYGKRFGFITQTQFLRDRFEMNHIGTVFVALQVVMMIPLIIIGVMGGGETLEGVSGGQVPFWLGGLIVAIVVMSYVFFGGMRGTAWVNTLQTVMFLIFGTIAFVVIARGMGGMVDAVAQMQGSLAAAPAGSERLSDGALLARHRIPFGYYASYIFIPLSSIMFPHMAIMCLTARSMHSFRKTIVLYPLCIMAVWVPAVLLGAVAAGQPRVVTELASNSSEFADWMAGKPTRLGAALDESSDPEAVAARARPQDALARLAGVKDRAVRQELRRLANANADGVMLKLLDLYSPLWLAGILGAAIMAVVMASDSQILAMSTLWAEDVFAHYGGARRFGDQAQVTTARVFVVIMTVLAYLVAINVREQASIFEIGVQYAFSGFASTTPIMLAALFWKRATKWGVLASTLWIAFCLIAQAWIQAVTAAPTQPGGFVTLWAWGDLPILNRETVRLSMFEGRLLTVVPMIVGAAVWLWLVSLMTQPPSAERLRKYFG